MLPHSSLEERLQLALPGSELPVWWSSPQHDHELMLGAARHGVSRTEHSIFQDPDFSFQQARLDYLNQQASVASSAAAAAAATPSVQVLVKEEGAEEEESRLLGSDALCQSDSPATSLADHPEGKGRRQAGWGWKKSRGRGPRRGGRKGGSRGEVGEEGGASDSESDSDSDSSTSSRRSGSSDESADSDTERGRGEILKPFM